MSAENLEKLAQHLEDLPMFPLPQTVLFPHTTLPLHIFEPRYRQMVRDARDEGMPIAMALIIPDGGTDEHGRPRVENIAGVGFIEALEELPDGRFLLELRGAGRVEFLEEHPPEKTYRRVRARLLEQDDGGDDIAEHLQTLELLVMSMRNVNARVAEYLSTMMAEVETSDGVADVVGSVLFPEPAERQALLAELDVEKRLEQVVKRLSELLAMATVPDDDTQFN